MNKLSIKSFTLSCGIMWGLAMLVLAWISSFGWGIRDVSVIAGIYLGYEPTFLGGIIGAIWGFVDGAIAGFILSYFYNLFLRKFKSK